MSSDILQFDNFFDEDALDIILKEALDATEDDWALFNEKANGVFWDNKRLITRPENSRELTDAVHSVFKDKYNTTISNKVQRFFYPDALGPLADAKFNPKIKYGSILFLNDIGKIEFTNLGLSIKAEKNKFVVYPADTEYLISCDSKNIMYFITIFYTQVDF